MARQPARAAGRWASLTADAIGVYLKRSGISVKDFHEAAGMTNFYYYGRIAGRFAFTLNDIEAMCAVLEVTPLEVATMATKLGELDPADSLVESRGDS